MDVALLVCAGTALVAGLGALLLASRTRRAARRDLEAARAEGAELRRRLDELEAGRGRVTPTGSARPAAPAAVTPSVPLGLPDDGDPDHSVGAAAVEGRALPAPVFTDMVLRESVIRLASLTHGVRRALNAETRNRVRFEMRREVRRARKQRRSDMKAALRRMQAEEREAA
ncbi:hypothetical protein [Nocardioides sp. CFH 31398]|uniref:hypothetical protein n=1 Tax=Nocardioides sp. CFH 31398 TaxID=2919579 RepID=UPI001F06A653|nr:hypothetical protein [Nocardioides sp. CFH 31398]MCH1867394.1 hypothetical protein [Nocardioides sp. CFH 31398]MCH1868609.1 hypothetical protein [Nocardioides sp. CFH 31398]